MRKLNRSKRFQQNRNHTLRHLETMEDRVLLSASPLEFDTANAPTGMWIDNGGTGGTYTPGQSMQCTITVDSTAAVPAGSTVSVNLPTGLSFSKTVTNSLYSFSTGGAAQTTGVKGGTYQGGGSLKWTLPAMTAGEVLSVSFLATPIAASISPTNPQQTLTVAATITSTGGTSSASTTAYYQPPSQNTSTTTTTSLTSSASPAYSGSTVTLAATVTSNNGNPSGSVSFYNNYISATSPGTLLGTSTLSGGQATLPLTVSYATSSTYSITAQYVSDGSFEGSTSGNLPLKVNQCTATVSVSSSQNPSTKGNSVTLTATVGKGANGTSTPVGTVTFSSGGTTLGTATLNSSGVATLSTSALPAGTDTITATFKPYTSTDPGYVSADSDYSSTTNSTFQQTVNLPVPTVTVTSSNSPSVAGGSVNFTASVSGTAGTATGTVAFTSNGTILGTASLTNGTATLPSVSSLTTGSYLIQANYTPDTASPTVYQPSSGTVSQTVNSTSATPTTTTLSSTTATYVGVPVTFTATVSPSNTGAPVTGSVTFQDGSTVLGPGIFISGTSGQYKSASYLLSAGSHTISASYHSGNYESSTSTAVTQVINLNTPTITSITSSAASPILGSSVIFTVTLSGTVNGVSTYPTGSVKFWNNYGTGSPTLLGTVTLTNTSAGQASLPVSTLPAGSNSITAVYAGDSTNYSGVTSVALSQAVVLPTPTISLSTSSSTSISGNAITLTANTSISLTGPSEFITFYNNYGLASQTSLGTGTISNGVASLSTSALAIGTYSITAVYAGDSTNYNPATSSALIQTVNPPIPNVTLTTSNASPVQGASVTFTATVTDPTTGTGITKGTVDFYSSNGLLLNSTPVSLGAAIYSTTDLPVGSQSIKAVYSGQPGVYQSKSSIFVAETVTSDNAVPVTMTLSSSSLFVSYGTSVTLTVNVVPVTVGDSVTGSVYFYNNNDPNPLGSIPSDSGTFSSGSGSITLSTLPAGMNTITASYSGNYSSATASLDQFVTEATSVTQLQTVNTSYNVGSTMPLTATVSDVAGAPVTTGRVSFYNQSQSLGAAPVNTGQAQILATGLPIGTYAITAIYNDDLNQTNYLPSQSFCQFTNVIPLTPTITLVNSATGPAVKGSSVTLTATVGSGASGLSTPTGKVTFYNGATELKTVALTKGSASYSTTLLPVGINTLSCVYSGDNLTYSSVTSSEISQTVVLPTPALITSVSPGTLTLGGSANFTASASRLQPGLQGSYYNLTGATNLISPAATSNASWLGNQTPVLTVPLLGPIDFPNIATNGFADSVGNPAYYNLGNGNVNVEARWYGNILIPGTGTTPVPINFSTTSDDGSMLYVDGNVVVSNDAPQAAYQVTKLVYLTPGLHAIDIEYYQAAGYASMVVQWDPSGGTSFVDIPKSAFFLPQTAGLQGSYYNLPAAANLIQPAAPSNASWLGNQTPVLTTPLLGPIDFPNIATNGFADSLGNPAYYNLGNGINANIEARWYGNILIPGTGTTPVPINFSTTSDDGSVLYIDGNAVVNTNYPHGATQGTNVVLLTPGLHAIDIEYYQIGGDASMVVQWDPTGGTRFVDIPQSALFSDVTVTPTGYVVFVDSTGKSLGSAMLASGSCTVSIPFLSQPSQPFSALYFGDSNFAATSSTINTITVQNPSDVETTTSVSTNTSSLYGNQSAILTATVSVPTASLGSAITGSVTFMIGSTPLTTVPISSTGSTGSSVTVSTTVAASSLVIGSNTITAFYNYGSSSGNYSPSNSSTTITRNQYTSYIQVSSSSSTWYSGSTISLTASVTGSDPSASPTGTVTFTDATGVVIGSQGITNSNGIATVFYTLPSVSSSNQISIFAKYSPADDSNYLSSSATLKNTNTPLTSTNLAFSTTASMGSISWSSSGATAPQTAPKYVPGNVLSYTFTVQNNDPSQAISPGTQVLFTAPQGYTIVNSIQPSGSSQSTSGSVLTWTLGSLAASQSVQLIVGIQAAVTAPISAYTFDSSGNVTGPAVISGVNGIAAPVVQPTVILPAAYVQRSTSFTSFAIPIVDHIVYMTDSIGLPAYTPYVQDFYAGTSQATAGQFCVSYTVRQLIGYYNNFENQAYSSANRIQNAFSINLNGGTYTFASSGSKQSNDKYQLGVTNPNHYTTARAPLLITNGTINANRTSRAFFVDQYQDLVLSNVVVVNGLENGGTPSTSATGTDALGGGIYVNAGGTLNLQQSSVVNCAALGAQGTAVTADVTTKPSGRHGVGFNAAGGGIYGAAGSNISIDAQSSIINNRALGGRGGKVTHTGMSGGTGGSAFGGGIAINAPLSNTTQQPAAKVSTLSIAGGAVLSGNVLNVPGSQTTSKVGRGTGGTVSHGTGGAGGNAFGAGIYMNSGTLNLNGGSSTSRLPICVTGNTQYAGPGYTLSGITSGANGQSSGVLYLQPSQVNVQNAPTGNGLMGSYYNLPAATNQIQPAASSNGSWLGNQTPVLTAPLLGPIDFPNIQSNGFADSVGNPAYYNLGNGNNNNVEARWYGQILIPGTGTTPVPINFATTSDDGSMLYIDGNAVVNNNYTQGATQRTGLVSLTPGLHTIDIEYYQGGGGATMDVQWDPTGGTSFVDIPNSAFFLPQAAGLLGSYYNLPAAANQIQPATPSNASWLGNQTPVVTTPLLGPIDFPNIQSNGFADSVGNPAYYNLGNGNNYYVEARWYGNILIPGTGTTPVPINFATTSDDGSMLYIDGNAVVSNNAFQAAHTSTGLVSLTPGLHMIDIEYYQGSGGATMDVQWDPTGGTNFVDIPNSALSHASPTGIFSFPGDSSPTAPVMSDGGFESPSVGNAFTYAPSGTPWSFTPQTVSGGSGITGNGSAFTSGNSNAPEGSQVAFLQGPATISQSLSGFQVGLAYSLTFEAATRLNYGSTQSSFSVSANGVQIGTFSPQGGYQPYVTSLFRPTSSTVTITFTGAAASTGNQTSLIDNLQVQLGAPVVSNGGFETPTISGNSWPGVSSLAGQGVIWTGTGGITPNNTRMSGPPAPQGNQYAYLYNSGQSLSQTISGLQVGQPYYISMLAAARGTYSDTAFQVTANGLVIGSYTVNDHSFETLSTAVFRPSSSTVTLTFTNIGSGGDQTTYLDEIQVHSLVTISPNQSFTAGTASPANLFLPTVTTAADGQISGTGVWNLRTAVEAANALSASGMPISLNLSAGTYILTQGSIPVTTSGTGSLAIHGVGAGTSSTTSTMISGNNSSSVGSLFNVSSASVAFSNLTLENGSSTTNGGAISVVNSRPSQRVSLAQVSILSCSASNNGGGIYQKGGSLTLTDTKIADTKANIGNNQGAGGAIYTEAGCTVNITGDQSSGSSLFSGNTARYGGAINTVGCNISINGVQFQGNVATSNGGAISVSGGSLTLVNATLHGNSASGNGGAVLANAGATVSAKKSKFTNNSGLVGGALAVFDSGNMTLSLTSDSISSNTVTAGAGNCGGGVYQNGGSLNIHNSKFASNKTTAGWGGGIYMTNITASVTGGSFTSNASSGYGGGIYVQNSSSTPVSLTGVTFTSNSCNGGPGGGIAGVNVSLTLDHCNFTSNSVSQNGGAVWVSGSSVLKDTHGTYQSNSAYNGGAIAADPSNGHYPTVTISNANLSSNTASSNGGGLYAHHGNIVLKNDTFKKNKAASRGGGTAFSTATVLLKTLQVSSNSITGSDSSWTSTGGGGLYAYHGSLQIQNSSFKLNNSKAAPGAGLAVTATRAWKMTNVNISSNKVNSSNSAYGGGLFLNGGTLNATNINILNNQVDSSGSNSYIQGGGIYAFSATMNFSGILNINSNSLSGASGGYALGAGVLFRNGAVFNAYTSWSLSNNIITGVENGVGAGIVAWDSSSLNANTPSLSGNSAPAGGNNLAFGVLDPLDDSSNGSFTNFTSSSGSLRNAIGSAQGLADGVWASVGVILNSNTTYYLKSPLNILTAGEVTISSVSGNSTINAQGNGRVMTIGNTSWHGTYVLNSVNISGGRVSGGDATGGGIYLNAGTLKLNNCDVSNNIAQGGNGYSPPPSQDWNTWNKHTSKRFGASAGGQGLGGGIFQNSGNLYILGSTVIQGNRAQGGQGGNGTSGHSVDGNPGQGGANAYGGGIYQASGTLKIGSSASVHDNTAQGGNGGNGGNSSGKNKKNSGKGGPGGYARGGAIWFNDTFRYENGYSHWSNSVNGGNGGSGHSSGTNATGYLSTGGNISAEHTTSGADVSPLAIVGMYQASGSLARQAIPLSDKQSTPASITSTHGQPLVGLVLELYSADGKLIEKSKSDSGGLFLFRSKYTGTGYLRVVLPPTHKLTPRGTKTDAGIASTFDHTTGKSELLQFQSGVVMNARVHLVLHRFDNVIKTGANFVELYNKETHTVIWHQQLEPKSYKGGFSISQIDVNGDKTADYLVIPKKGPATPFLLDGRTGAVQKIKGQVAGNLRKGFTVQAQNITGSDGFADLVLIPKYLASGQISVINFQTRRVAWSSQSVVTGGMNVNFDSATDTRDYNVVLTSYTYNKSHHGYAQTVLGAHTGKVLVSGFVPTPTSPPISPPSQVIQPKALKHEVGQVVPRVSGFARGRNSLTKTIR